MEDREAKEGTVKSVQGRLEEDLTWPHGQEEKIGFEMDLEDRVKCSLEAQGGKGWKSPVGSGSVEVLGDLRWRGCWELVVGG